jgi:hypothetical protein
MHFRVVFMLIGICRGCRFGFKTCPANSDCYCAFNLNLVVLEFCVSWDCAPSADPEL